MTERRGPHVIESTANRLAEEEVKTIDQCLVLGQVFRRAPDRKEGLGRLVRGLKKVVARLSGVPVIYLANQLDNRVTEISNTTRHAALRNDGWVEYICDIGCDPKQLAEHDFLP